MLGRFRYDPKDEIKTQTESDAVQPYKFYFGEPRIGDQAGTAAGGGHEKEKKKKKTNHKKTKERERQKARKRVLGGVGRGSVTTTTDLAYHHYRFGNVQRCSVGSASVQAWRPQRGRGLAAMWRAREQEGSEEHVLSFYRGICSCTVHAVRVIRAARLDKSSFASPHTSPCTRAFLQIIVALFSEVRKR